MEGDDTEIGGVKYKMFTLDPSCFGDCFFSGETEFNTIINRMRELEYISDTYTRDCIRVAENTQCYENWRNYNNLLKAHGIGTVTNTKPDTKSSLGPVGHQICGYKAVIVVFIYMYFKENRIDWKSWSKSWALFLNPKLLSNYANNLYYLLRYNALLPDIETFPMSPEGSCIGYVISKDFFYHAFLMILEGDYFVIYDAWSRVRTKWVRALEKDQAIEILDKLNDKKNDIELRRKLFAYFFAPKKTKINFFHTSNFSSDWYIVYIPLESELFRDAFERSNGEMLFSGGKSRRKRISKRSNKISNKISNKNKLKINRKYNVSKKCR